MTNLTEISGRVDAKLQEIKTVLDKTRDSQTPKSEIPTLTERFRALDAELNDLKSQEEVLKAADATEKEIKARSEATNLPNISRPEGGQRTVKSLAEMILEIPGFKENAKKAEKDLDQNLGRQITDYNYVAGFKSRGLKANTLTTDASSAGIPTYPDLLDIYVPSAQRIPTILPYLPMLPITTDNYEYRRETTFNNNVSATAQNAALSQSDFDAVTVTGKIHTVGHYLSVTIQELNDVPRMAMILNQRGQLMMDQGLETQSLTGNGSGDNFTGFYNVAGIGSYATGTNNDSNGNPENNIDALWRGLVDLRINGRCHPSLIVMHDTNLTPIVLLKNSLGDYIYGDPSSNSMLVEGETNSFIGRVWGIPLQNTTAAVLGSALIGDFNTYCALAVRQGLEVSIEKINDDAIKLRRTLVMFTRGNLEVYRAAAFEKVTNLS